MSIFFTVLFILLILVALLISINIILISISSKKNNTYYGGSESTDHFRRDIINAVPFICTDPEIQARLISELSNDEFYMTALQRYALSINPQNNDLDSFVENIYSTAIYAIAARPNESVLNSYVNNLYFNNNRIYEILNIVINLINENITLHTIEIPPQNNLPNLIPNMLEQLKISINDRYYIQNIKTYFVSIINAIHGQLFITEQRRLQQFITNLNENETIIDAIFGLNTRIYTNILPNEIQFIVNFNIYVKFILPIREIILSQQNNETKYTNIKTIIRNLLSNIPTISPEELRIFDTRQFTATLEGDDSLNNIITSITTQISNFYTKEKNWSSRKGIAIIGEALKNQNSQMRVTNEGKHATIALMKKKSDISAFLGTP